MAIDSWVLYSDFTCSLQVTLLIFLAASLMLSKRRKWRWHQHIFLSFSPLFYTTKHFLVGPNLRPIITSHFPFIYLFLSLFYVHDLFLKNFLIHFLIKQKIREIATLAAMLVDIYSLRFKIIDIFFCFFQY